jgi:predicted branched-subunit amino acid permease
MFRSFPLRTIMDDMRNFAPPFTLRGFRAGALTIGPFLPGVMVYGVAFGVMAAAAGLNTLEASMLSMMVNAGGAQIASLQAWDNPVPVLAVGLTTLAMNSRYLLFGAALRPWFAGLPPHQSYPSLFVMGDVNWALSLREREAGRNDAAFLAGSGVVLWLVWVATTALGQLFGQVIDRPEKFGVDFMLAAFFASMSVAFLRRPGSFLPFVIGGGVAAIVERLTQGPWYILAGAAVGSLAGALRHADPA